MEQLNSNIERVIEANSTIEVFNTGAFYALVRAYKYVVVDNKPVKEKINVPFAFDLYNKDNDKISTGTISPGEKATFKVPTYKMVINNTYDYEVHIVYSFGSGTVSQLKTDLEMTTEDIASLTQYDKRDFDLLTSINALTFTNLESLAHISTILSTQTAIDKTPKLIHKYPIFISLDSTPNTYFNAIDLDLEFNNGRKRPYFISYVDISLDYSQIHKSTTNLIINNTFNPGMSFGHYDKLKTLVPDTRDVWNNYPWTYRADIKLPTKSKLFSMRGGDISSDGNYRIDINNPYGTRLSDIYNFIIRTDLVLRNNLDAGYRKAAIRKYTDITLDGRAELTENILADTYSFKYYNKCSVQKPNETQATNMIMVDVCVYGYLLEQDLEE